MVLILVLMGCGAITIRLDTEIADETEITHDMQINASGQIATLWTDEFDSSAMPPEFEDNCTSTVEFEMFEVKCSGLSQSLLSEGEVGDSGINVSVTKTDKGDYWEYRAVMASPVSGSDEELEDNPFAQGMSLDAILRFRFYWSVKMPGDIVETNADTTEKNVASFTVKLDDKRDNLVVVSQQEKSAGLFGSCN